MNQSAIDIEFLTESGADHYIESVTAAARLVVAALCGASRPGLVAGSSSLRQQIRKLQLAPRDGVGLHAVLRKWLNWSFRTPRWYPILGMRLTCTVRPPSAVWRLKPY